MPLDSDRVQSRFIKMGPTPVFEVKQLKDAYSKLFDWEWRYQLFEQLSKGKANWLKEFPIILH